MTSKKILVIWFFTTGLFTLIWSITAVAQKSLVVETERKTLNIPVAVFIVDADNGDDEMSSQRSADSMGNHFLQVNRVWTQAGIEINPVTVKRISVPADLLRGLIQKRGRGGIANFFRAIRREEIDLGKVNNNALVWAFYVRSLGGPNGLKPQGVNSIFVIDEPSNEGYRVTSHEIGHILGLYHTRDAVNNLLFPGSNGLVLTDEEKTVARYYAERMLR